MRRRRPEKRTILPDPTYKDYTVAKFINYLMKNGKKSIAVVAPAFSSDCVETLEEINEEIAESFSESGGENFLYIPCRGT